MKSDSKKIETRKLKLKYFKWQRDEINQSDVIITSEYFTIEEIPSCEKYKEQLIKYLDKEIQQLEKEIYFFELEEYRRKHYTVEDYPSYEDYIEDQKQHTFR